MKRVRDEACDEVSSERSKRSVPGGTHLDGCRPPQNFYVFFGPKECTRGRMGVKYVVGSLATEQRAWEVQGAGPRCLAVPLTGRYTRNKQMHQAARRDSGSCKTIK